MKDHPAQPKKFKGKYRNGTFRCSKWNYTSEASYLVTICTKNRNLNVFGTVQGDEMILNDIGLITDVHWHQIPLRFPFVHLDEYIIMPDHLHGILHFNRKDHNCRCVSSKRTYNQPRCRTTYSKQYPRMSAISPDKGSLGVIIRLFKGDCTKSIKSREPEFQWQRRFHDRIIRSEYELHQIRKYIRENPQKWNPEEHDDFWKLLE